MSKSTPDYLKEILDSSVKLFKNRQFGDIAMATTAPRNPVIMIYVGKEPKKTLEGVWDELYRIWPAYVNKFLFLTACLEDGTMKIRQYKSTELNSVTEDEVQRLIGDLMGEEKVFESAITIRRYFVLDASSFQDVKEYEHGLKSMEQSKKCMGQGIDFRDMQFLLLDEYPHRMQLAKQIRIHLAQISGQTESPSGNGENSSSVIVISNRKLNGALVNNWKKAYGAMALLLAQSNQREDLHIADIVFAKGIKTIAFSKVSKPVEDIVQTLVKTMLEEMHGAIGDAIIRGMNPDTIRMRLGVEKDGTFSCISKYLKDNGKDYIPDSSKLDLFPRKEMVTAAISKMSFSEANEITMNSLAGYLKVLEEKIIRELEEVEGNHEIFVAYKDALMKHCTREELIYLKGHRSECENAVNISQPTRLESDSKGLFETMLPQSASQSEGIRTKLWAIVEESGRMGEKFIEDWNHLYLKISELLPPSDESITTYYTGMMKRYIDRHRSELKERMQSLRNMSDVQELVLHSLRDLMDKEEIFSYGFEKEMMQRLGAADDPARVNQMIMTALIEDVPVYFYSYFGDPEIVNESISIRQSEGMHSLYKAIQTSFQGRVMHYYDIATKDYAVAMKIAKLDWIHIKVPENDSNKKESV